MVSFFHVTSKYAKEYALENTFVLKKNSKMIFSVFQVKKKKVVADRNYPMSGIAPRDPTSVLFRTMISWLFGKGRQGLDAHSPY